MKDKWYSDNRDIVKWGGIVHLCDKEAIRTVVQVAYYRKDEWGKKFTFDNENVDLPAPVRNHFRRDIKHIKSLGTRAKLDIRVICRPFENRKHAREDYHRKVCDKIKGINKNKKVVFLDPDIGLEPIRRCTDKHVKPEEVRHIWESLNPGDFLVFYQHKPQGSDKHWKEKSRSEFARRCRLKNVRLWSDKEIAGDVVFYFKEKEKTDSE